MAETQSEPQEDIEEIYRWIIPNFDNVQHEYYDEYYIEREQIVLHSPSFESTNKQITWRIILYPNGEGRSQKNGISIYLECLTCSPADITVKYELSILDKNGTERRKSEYCIAILDGNSQPLIGFPNFIDKLVLNTATTRRPAPRNGRNNLQSSQAICTIVYKWRITNCCTIGTSKTLSLWRGMRKNFKISLESGKFNDVTLVAGEREFPAHKVILATHSPVFAAMFGSEMQEQKNNRVIITDIDEDVLEQLLQFLYYVDDSRKLDKMAQSLLIVADKYDIKQLKDVCEESLVKSLKVKNSVEILILADRCDAKYLKKKAIDFIVVNAGEIVTKEIDLPLNGHLLSEVFRKLALKDMKKNSQALL